MNRGTVIGYARRFIKIKNGWRWDRVVVVTIHDERLPFATTNSPRVLRWRAWTLVYDTTNITVVVVPFAVGSSTFECVDSGGVGSNDEKRTTVRACVRVWTQLGRFPPRARGNRLLTALLMGWWSGGERSSGNVRYEIFYRDRQSHGFVRNRRLFAFVVAAAVAVAVAGARPSIIPSRFLPPCLAPSQSTSLIIEYLYV